MRLEDHLNRANEEANMGQYARAIAQLACAIQVAAGGGPSIYTARKTFKDAFKEDPVLLEGYHSNIAGLIMDFERQRHIEPGVVVGPMTANERDALAHNILRLIFGV
jgi:hypothetical protein